MTHKNDAYIFLCFSLQKTLYFKVEKVNSLAKPELFTIRRLGEKKPLKQLFYASQLVKSKLTPDSNLKWQVRDHRDFDGKPQSLLKFRSIRKPEWINDGSFTENA